MLLLRQKINAIANPQSIESRNTQITRYIVPKRGNGSLVVTVYGNHEMATDLDYEMRHEGHCIDKNVRIGPTGVVPTLPLFPGTSYVIYT